MKHNNALKFEIKIFYALLYRDRKLFKIELIFNKVNICFKFR